MKDNKVKNFQQALSIQDICCVVEHHSKPTARHRLYPPLKTLSLFIWQILAGARTCQDAVVRNLSERVSLGVSPSSLNTAAYCEARMRLPTAIAATLGSLLSERLECLTRRATKRRFLKAKHKRLAWAFPWFVLVP
ncbi:hypothetical protein [Simplicispira psychrophila]|uniref:hypothetical protein n=1 Tax=Simplicispira psychrophila TaxID=80882 RepID=UPI0012EBAAB0|nr:hypothetical protein [Simplicispira psychrophila]